jgi:penicillin amidase
MRTIGYTDEELTAGYEALDLETRIMLDGYTDGINNRIDEIIDNQDLLPFEFARLHFTPAYWTPEDVLAWEPPCSGSSTARP